MTRLFIHIYLAIVIAMGFVTWLMVTLTRANDEHVTAEIRVSMQWMADRIVGTAPHSEDRRRVVSDIHRLVGPSVAIVPTAVLDLSPAEMQRLRRGEMVFTGSRQSHYAYLGVPGEDRVLEWQVHERANPLALIMSLPSHLAMTPEDRGRYGVVADAIPLDRLDHLDELQRARLHWRPITVPEGVAEMATYRMPGPGRDVMRVAVGAGLNISIDWIAPFLSLFASAIAIMVTVYPLHRKLSHLSRVAERFGNGDLTVRAQQPGRGPIEDLAGRFDHMAERVALLIQSNEELLRAVAHELRTPIARIMFAAHLARQAEDVDKRDQLFDKIDRAAADLDDLTAELLSFCRLGDDTPELACNDTTPDAILDAVQSRIDNPAVVIRKSPDGAHPLRGDSRQISRAIGNLIGNACRYAEARVEVSYCVARGPDCDQAQTGASAPGREYLYVYVDDDGPGVPIALREQVFAPFSRAESSRTRVGGGAGLGLAIVARIASRHGGSAHVEDSPLGGARFVFTLPTSRV